MNGMREELPAAHIREGFGHSKTRNPGALSAAIAIHLGVAGVVMMMPGVTFVPPVEVILEGREIKLADPPPRVEPEESKPLVQPQPASDAPKTATKPDPVIPIIGAGPQTDGGVIPAGDGGPAVASDPPADPLPPVLTGARIDPRYADRLQPAYPAAMIRLGVEGSVTVRVTIDDRGRVIEVALVRSDDPAFFEATRRHALRSWRFVPAMRDGQPVAATREMTVHFRLDDR